MKYFLYQCIVLVPMYCMALDEINAMSRRNAMKYFMRIFSSGAMHHRRGLERQGGIRYALQCIGTPGSNIFTDVESPTMAFFVLWDYTNVRPLPFPLLPS